jgi:uncharacterized protein
MSGATSADKERRLDAILEEMVSVAVAFSGGVDSAYLAVRAHRVLGERAVAVTADSPSLASAQRDMALALAREFGFAHRVSSPEVEDPTRNDRCFHCRPGCTASDPSPPRGAIAYGAIVDDLSDVRPGHRAAADAGVRSPLVEAEMTKADVRERSRAMGLPTWDLPASPCLSSRIPRGTAVTPEILRQVERAEEAVRALGFRELRVRHLGETARVEIAPLEMSGLDGSRRAAIEQAVLGAGYRACLIDPDGYRRGRLNEPIPLAVIGPA